jgi:NLI interacting factor-like phosphatase
MAPVTVSSPAAVLPPAFPATRRPSGPQVPVCASFFVASTLTPRCWPTCRRQVVLDLDETLVCAFRSSALPDFLQAAGAAAAAPRFELSCDLGQGSVEHVTVCVRPGLLEFLQRVAQFAELVLFTAGLPSEWRGGSRQPDMGRLPGRTDSRTGRAPCLVSCR